ncbi:MAG TPA: hypothetical protein VF543_02505 [Pyrinomonadaceae bacterium]|jgi:hypothetical protein
MYKPNFCAECGEKITRTRWRAWTSRSFCQTCEGRYRRRRFLVPLITAVALLSTGLLMGRAMRPQPPPLTVQRGELPAVSTVTATSGSAKSDRDTEAAANASSSSNAPKTEPGYGPDGTSTERPTDPEEIVSLCGARTQKGTPCQRRVRGTGRCWQHKVIR